jgi:hypothetical protein
MVLGIVAATSLLLSGAAQAESIQELVRRADMVFRGTSSAAVMAMEIKTQSHQRSFRMVSWDDSRGPGKTLIKILGPASWRGHATLKIGNKLKIYDPKTNHVQVVGHSMLGSSWMGSHFSNDDLVKETQLAKDYSLRLIKKWRGATPDGGTGTHYRIAMTPKPNAPIAWGRIEYALWKHGKHIAPTAAEYFRRVKDSSPARRIAFSNVKDMAGRSVPTSMKVTLASKPGEFTRLVYKKLKLNIKIPAKKFSEGAMRK